MLSGTLTIRGFLPLKSFLKRYNNILTTYLKTRNADTTNNRVIDVSEATSNDTTDSRTNDADTHNTISPLDLNSCVGSGDVGDDPWLFRNKNITCLFKVYQSIVQSLVSKHEAEALPLESYINELAALTHILVLNKHQHSPIAKKVFSDELLDDLKESMASESMNYTLCISEQ